MSCALSAVLARARQAEVALVSGEHVAACLWDMTKLFDMVDLTILVPAAHRLRFPPELLFLASDVHIAPRRLTTHSA